VKALSEKELKVDENLEKKFTTLNCRSNQILTSSFFPSKSEAFFQV